MKTQKFITFYLLFFCFLPVYAHDYWADNNRNQDMYIDGVKIGSGISIAEVYESSPCKLSDISCSSLSQITTSDNVIVNVSGTISWYNFSFHRVSYWYRYNIRCFDVTYKIEYTTSGTSQWRELFTLNEMLIKDGCGETAPDINYQTHAATRYMKFSKQIETGKTLPEGIYSIRVTVTAHPSNVSAGNSCSGATNYMVGPEDGNTRADDPFLLGDGSYLKNGTSAEMQSSESKVTVSINDGNRPSISVDLNVNPVASDGTFMVYNAPNAPVSVRFSSNNVDQTKNPRAVFFARIGSGSFPTYSQLVSDYQKYPSGGCTSSNCSEATLVWMTDASQKLIKEYAQTQIDKGLFEYGTSYNNSRLRHVMLRSTNAGMTEYVHDAITSLVNLTPDDNGNFIDRTYSLRDLSLAARPGENTIMATGAETGAEFKITGKLIYYDYENSVLSALGIMNYTSRMAYGKLLSATDVDGNPSSFLSNLTLNYRVVGPVILPTPQQTTAVYVCGKNSEMIHLQGSYATSTSEISLFDIEYVWQYKIGESSNWQDISDDVFSSNNNYVVSKDEYILSGITGIDENTDIVIRGSLISDLLSGNNATQVQFRQKAVIKNFTSPDRRDNFTSAQTINDKAYYALEVTPENDTPIYTVSLLPSISNSNFAWLTGINEEEYITGTAQDIYIQPCSGEEITEKYMKFSLQSTYNNPLDDVQIASAVFKVYKVDKDGESKELLRESTNSEMEYSIEYDETLGDSIRYRCVVIMCDDSISRDVCIYPYPVDELELDKIETGGYCSIESTDDRTSTINLVCPKGEAAVISLNEIVTDASTMMFWRESGDVSTDCGEYPAFEPTDFSNYTNQECVDLINSKVAEGRMNWDFENVNGITFESATTYQLRDFCAEQERVDYETDKAAWEAECMKRYDWQEFSDKSNYSTELYPYDMNTGEALYFVRTRTAMGCYSDSIRISVQYVDPIVDNVIGFDTNCSTNSAYIVSGDPSPAVYGKQVGGGYGLPASGMALSYMYVWQYNTTDYRNEGFWIDLGVSVTDTDGSLNALTAGIMLPAKQIASVDKALWIRRIVYSLRNNDQNTRISSVSNVVSVSLSEDIEETSIKVEDGMCAGKMAKVSIIDDINILNEQTRYIVSCDNPEVEITQTSDLSSFPDMGNIITLYPEKDVTLLVSRYDGKTGSTSRAVSIPVDVMEAEASFSIVANNIEYSLEQAMSLMPGTRIELVNNSVGSDLVYKWTLQIQEFIEGMSIDGATTDVENPACYVYNAGINKIRLDVQTSTRDASGTMYCRSSVTADNIEVIDNGMYRNKFSGFVTGDGDDWQLTSIVETVSVYPTILDGASGKVTIETNKESYGVELYNVGGRLIYAESGLSGTSEIVLPFLQSGTYVLGVDGIPFKIISK